MSAATAARPASAPGLAPISADTWRLCALIACGAFMSGVDTTVVAVGLDTIARDLGAPLAQAQWIAGGYLVALGVSLPACGWLVRRFGAGRIWMVALAGFTIASVGCALARSVESLVALRVVQGLAAGLLIPAGQTTIGQAVGPERLGRVMSTLGLAVALAPAVGPVLGGITLDVASWPWLFLINLPVGVAVLALAWSGVPRGRSDLAARADRLGLALLMVAIPAFVYGATQWSAAGSPRSAGVLVPLGIGALAAALFGLHARGLAGPAVDLRLLRRKSFAAGALTAGFGGAALFGAGILFPLYFQLGRGAGVLESGLLLISASVGSAIVLPLGGRFVDRFGGGPVAVVGGAATLVTTLPFALLPVQANGALVQVLLLLRGMGLALTVMPATTAAYKAVAREQLPDATTLVNALMRVGGALGGALFATVLATTLDAGTEAAMHAAFGWLCGATALGFVSAIWLMRAESNVAATA